VVPEPVSVPEPELEPEVEPEPEPELESELDSEPELAPDSEVASVLVSLLPASLSLSGSVVVVSVELAVLSAVVVPTVELVDVASEVVVDPSTEVDPSTLVGAVAELLTTPSVSSGHAQLDGFGLSQRGSMCAHATASVSPVAAAPPHAAATAKTKASDAVAAGIMRRSIASIRRARGRREVVVDSESNRR